MIQIDIPMPTCCDECFALDDHGDYPFCMISQDQRGYTFNTFKNRMPTCPLKVQEPVKPIIETHWETPSVYDEDVKVTENKCGACGAEIDKWDKFCRVCGKAVKWE